MIRLLILFAAVTVLAPPARDADPKIAERISALEAHLSKKGKEDERAYGVITALAGDFAGAGPKDRGRIVVAFAAAARAPRAKIDKQTFDDHLALAAVKALGDLGQPGGASLIALLEEREPRKNPKVLEALLANLGRTRVRAGLPVLINHVSWRDLPSIRGAASGLAHFAEADGDTRKRGFEAAFKSLINVHDDLASRPFGSIGVEDYWSEVKTALAATLQALSRHEEKDVAGWQRWWNNNKSKSWDDAK